MVNTLWKMPLQDCIEDLVAYASGIKDADMVIRNIKLINVNTHEIQEDIHVAIVSGRIAYVGKAPCRIGTQTHVIDGAGQYIAPGFLDCAPYKVDPLIRSKEYAKALMSHGTVGICLDGPVLQDNPVASMLKIMDAPINHTANFSAPKDPLTSMRYGMYTHFGYGLAPYDLAQLASIARRNQVDTRFACLVTGATHTAEIPSQDYGDHLLGQAVDEGIDLITAITMMTLNVAQYLGVNQDMGSISPGKCADIIFIDNLANLQVTRTIINGELLQK